MPTSRLQIYNDALILCGERTLASLSEAREPRRVLDSIWTNGGVNRCLEQAQWKFAMRTQRLDHDPGYTSEFGYTYSFTKPSDWLVTSAVCGDEYFNSPILDYSEESGFIYCDSDPIYVRYVSSDNAYGGDLSLWTAGFADYVAAHFAARASLTLSSDGNKQKTLFALESKLKKDAASLDAMAQPAKFIPHGGWSASRTGGSRRDRGKRNTLIG